MADILTQGDNFCPDFDRNKYKLGQLCKRNHEWGQTGQTLRQHDIPNATGGLKIGICVECRRERARKKKPEFKPIAIFFESGLFGFNCSDGLIEIHVRYELRLKPETNKKTSKVCSHGHYWEDFGSSLRCIKNKEGCEVCGRINFRNQVESGRNAKLRARHYREHRESHNKKCLERYHRNPERAREVQKKLHRERMKLIESGELEQIINRENPCKKCGNFARYVVNQSCVECAKARARRHLKEKPDMVRETNRRWRWKNSVKMNSYREKWTEANPEKKNEISKRRLERLKKVRRVPYTDKDLSHLLKEFNNSCAYCGKEFDFSISKRRLSWDHFVPISKNGDDALWNLLPACKSCNSSKSRRDAEEWYSSCEHFSPMRWAKILECLESNRRFAARQINLIFES